MRQAALQSVFRRDGNLRNPLQLPHPHGPNGLIREIPTNRWPSVRTFPWISLKQRNGTKSALTGSRGELAVSTSSMPGQPACGLATKSCIVWCKKNSAVATPPHIPLMGELHGDFVLEISSSGTSWPFVGFLLFHQC
jgi:hypothetical protein